MKGVNRKVIEINEPDNEYIERVLVFVKPGKEKVKVSTYKAEAESFVSRLVCEERKYGAMWFVAGAVMLAAAVLLLIIIL